MAHTVTIKDILEEEIEIYVDDELIMTATHDEDGWSAMESLELLAKILADKLGANFESV